MAKIYISSTFNDLQEYRQKVSQVLRRLGHEDVAMEHYVAEDKRPVDKCLEDVASCDLYIGIFAWRHGYVPPDNNPNGDSITEMEYRQAVKTGKECLIFLLHEDAPWPRSFGDRNPDRIEQLRAELSGKHSVSFFKSPDELSTHVATAVHRWENRDSLAGSISGLKLGEYFEALRKRYSRLELDGLTPPKQEEYLQLQLRAIFVEPSVRENPPPQEIPKDALERLQRAGALHAEDFPKSLDVREMQRALDAYYTKPTRPVLDVLTEPGAQRTVLLGDPGAGKSTLTRFLIMSLVEPTGDSRIRTAFGGYLPLLVELRQFAGLRAEKRCETFLDYFDVLHRTEALGFPKEELENYLKDGGSAVVLFDGLDEIFDHQDREHITRQVAGFATNYRGAKVIISSRLIGYRRRLLENEGFRHFTLQDFNPEQVEAFLENWFSVVSADRPDLAEQRKERCLRAFKESRSLRQLAGNPLLLTILAIIGKNQELPRERWRLYEHASSVLMQHWDVNKHLRSTLSDAGFIDEEDKREMLRRVAYDMQSGVGGVAGNYIERDRLENEIEQYLRERYALPLPQAKKIARSMLEQMRERNFILSLYGANLYGFVHRALLEYFCAHWYVHKFEKTQELTLDALKELFRQRWEDPSWHEILRLICGMLEDKFAGELIDILTQAHGETPKAAWSQGKIQHLALATQCLSEVRSLSTISDASGRLLDMLCHLLGYSMAEDGNPQEVFDKDILPVIEAIGTRWPQRERLDRWLETRGAADKSLHFDDTFARFVVALGADRPTVQKLPQKLLKSPNPDNRLLAPMLMAFLEPKSSKLMRRLIEIFKNQKEHWSVRDSAAKALGLHFTTSPKVIDLFKSVLSDPAKSYMHFSALHAVGIYFPISEDFRLLLQQHAINNQDDFSRSTAMFGLAWDYQDTPETLNTLTDRASHDPYPPPTPDDTELSSKQLLNRGRGLALRLLFERFPSTPETLDCIARRAQEEPIPALRELAQQYEKLLREQRSLP